MDATTGTTGSSSAKSAPSAGTIGRPMMDFKRKLALGDTLADSTAGFPQQVPMELHCVRVTLSSSEATPIPATPNDAAKPNSTVDIKAKHSWARF
jgi:hypothetical protein